MVIPAAVPTAKLHEGGVTIDKTTPATVRGSSRGWWRRRRRGVGGRVGGELMSGYKSLGF
jgi:hypothetical protein